MAHTMPIHMDIIALDLKHVELGEERIPCMFVTCFTREFKVNNTLIICFVLFYDFVKHSILRFILVIHWVKIG